MHCHCCTNNRAQQWTFTDPCKPEVRPGAREESASPAWLAAPAMNARDTTIVYIWRLDTGCGPALYRKCHSHNTPGKRHNNTWVEPLAGNCITSSIRQREKVWQKCKIQKNTNTNLSPCYRTGHYYRVWLLYLVPRGFYTEFATGAPCSVSFGTSNLSSLPGGRSIACPIRISLYIFLIKFITYAVCVSILWPLRLVWLLVCCLYQEVYLQIFKYMSFRLHGCCGKWEG